MLGKETKLEPNCKFNSNQLCRSFNFYACMKNKQFNNEAKNIFLPFLEASATKFWLHYRIIDFIRQIRFIGERLRFQLNQKSVKMAYLI
jgi:hypothetical protein